MINNFCHNFGSFPIILIALSCIPLDVRSEKPTRNVLITAEEEKLRDTEGFAAIKAIHAVLDDDHSGSIDRAESADFLTSDLKFGGSDRERREKAFHNNDESITVNDLWESWFQSEERGWDNKQIVDWLINQVKLPHYTSNFLNAKVTGLDLPRMAIQNSSYLTNIVGVKNYVHRQKLQLKSLDLVLFGYQESSSLVKDIALAGLLGLLVAVLFMFKKHKDHSKKQVEELATVLNKLRDMETDFEGVQNKLEEENIKQQSSADGNENIEILKNQLRELENERRIAEANGVEIPFALQPLLRRTYEIEWAYLYQQKLECLHEMAEAKELVDKMRRKQTSFVNSLKLATGATSGTDDIDNKIFALKARMEKIKMALGECTHRWAEIESLCGFSITDSFGISQHAATIPSLNTQNDGSRREIATASTSFSNLALGEQQDKLSYSTSPEFSNDHLTFAAAPSGFMAKKVLDSQQFADPPPFTKTNNISQDNTSSIASSDLSGSIQSNKRTGKNRLTHLFRRNKS